MKSNQLAFSKFYPFQFSVNYIDIDAKASENQHEHHVHAECEIYLNLSGDVSFMVEDHIYPIVPGSMIITKPYEYPGDGKEYTIYVTNAAG